MNPYLKFVTDSVNLINAAKTLPLGGLAPLPRRELPADAPKALFFAPHPDDETIVGAIALRIARETNMRLIDVAVTQGSKKDRQAERLRELQAACDYLGYGLQTTAPNGLERVTAKTRRAEPQVWAGMVQVILEIMQKHQPRVVMFPHERDWNGTHIGTHHLVMDALRKMPATYEPYIVETEFWGAMDDPNLMIEVGAQDLADLIAATTFHVGEVKRNPYHLLLPAWMMDNVRRGAEVVGEQGGAAPDFRFAVLYRLGKWSRGSVIKTHEGGKQLPVDVNVGTLFP